MRIVMMRCAALIAVVSCGCAYDVDNGGAWVDPAPGDAAGMPTARWDGERADFEGSPLERIEQRDPSTTCPDLGPNDRDGDGLSDAEEVTTDPCLADTDGDGVGDLVEVAYDAACATNARCQPPEMFHVIVLPPGERGTVHTPVRTRPRSVDLVVIADATEGLSEAREALSAALQPEALELQDLAGDVFVGHGWAHRWAVNTTARPPFGLREEPFANGAGSLASLLDDTNEFLGEVDAPSHALALREALSRPSALPVGDGTFVDYDTVTCSSSDRIGGACRRDGALPIILHLGTHDFEWPVAPVDAELLSAFQWSGARYVGVQVGPAGCVQPGCPGMLSLGEATGSVDLYGAPFVSDSANASPEELSSKLRELLLRSVMEARTSVHPRLGEGAPFDVAMRVCRPSDGVTCVAPRPGISLEESVREATSDGGFDGVVPGTRVTFAIEVENLEVETQADSQQYRFPVQAIGAGASLLDEVEVHVLVPASR